MGHAYTDQDLSTGANDGTSWADAYQVLATAMADGTLPAGTDLWVQGTGVITGNVSYFGSTDPANPIRVHAVKLGTTNEPPFQSDLVVGLRSGDASPAHENTPVKITGGVGFTITFQRHRYFYGFSFDPGAFVKCGDTGSLLSGCCFDECEFIIGSGDEFGGHFLSFGGIGEGGGGLNILENCSIKIDNSGNFIKIATHGGTVKFNSCIFPAGGLSNWTTLLKFDSGASPIIEFNGCDVSLGATALADVTGMSGGYVKFKNCKTHASAALITGTITTTNFRVENHGSSTQTGLGSGDSVQALRIETENGTIENEVTAVRTNGAGDKATGLFSWKLTPGVEDTQDNYAGLESSEIHGWVKGDGTSKVLTVYIANSGSGDYKNNEVYLKAFFPDAAGTAQYDYVTTQMELLDTPANITDDTDSTWGTGANNPQKLQVSIAPDYQGSLRWQVFFAKNFSSSPESLYVCPRAAIS